MEKDQPDSLATVTVGSEKMPQTHSHYAPSEVYSSAEPPPAYMRPMKSTSVQIARIAAMTLITMSVVLGSFILAASWVQARASCTPESIAAMKAHLRLQDQQQQASDSYLHHAGFLKRLQPEALVQDIVEPKDNNLQSLSDSALSKKDTESEAKDVKVPKEDENSSKADSESGDHDEDDDDDDYDDDEFPPVHIKLPLQLDLDDIAGTLMQQARSRVSCVVERRRADEVMDGSNDNNLENSTDPQRFQRLSGERVAILCESGNPNQEQQGQDMLTPIIVPLGTVQIPLHQQEPSPGYHHYQVPDMQQLPLSDPRGLNHIPAGILPPELRNLPHLTMEMRPPRMGPHVPMQAMPQSPIIKPHMGPMMGPQMEMRQIPIELHHYPMDSMRGMRPPMPQDQQAEQVPVYGQDQQDQQDQQGAAMMPPPPPPPSQPESQMHEQRTMPQMMIIPQTEQRPPMPERPQSPFQGIPIKIRNIIQQVPLEIKNIIQHITGEPFPLPIPDGARRENVQEFKPFPEGARPIPLSPFPLPVEIRNLLEHGNIEGRPRSDSSEEQQEAKPFPGPEDQGEEIERNFPVSAEVRNIIHQIVEGRAFPAPNFLPLRPVESIEVPVEARAEVADVQSGDQQTEQRTHEQQQQPMHLIIEHQDQQQQQQQQPQEQEEENRPHYVQPRSVRSVPEPFAHRREKRVRRCACDCAC